MPAFAAWHDSERYSVIIAESADAVHTLAAERGVSLVRVDALPRRSVKTRVVEIEPNK